MGTSDHRWRRRLPLGLGLTAWFEDVSREPDDRVDVGVGQCCSKRWHLAVGAPTAVHDDLALFGVGEAVLDLLNVDANAPGAGAPVTLCTSLFVDSEALPEFVICVVGENDRIASAGSQEKCSNKDEQDASGHG